MMDLEVVILSGVSQRQTSYGTAYMWNLKKKKSADEFIYKTETDYSHSKQTYGYKGESRERDKFGVWD